MTGEISTIAKYVFLLYFIAAVIFGALWFLAPEYASLISGWPMQVASSRMVGMVTLVMAIGSFLAYYRATSLKQIEIYVVMGIVFNIIGIVGMLWDVLTSATLPVFASWSLIGVLTFFSVSFLYIFFTLWKK